MFVFLFSSSTLAETIWRIGIDNNSDEEYEHPQSDPNLNQEIIKYRVPQDWDTRGMGDWKSFPCKLWPSEALEGVQFYPKEIHITCDYSGEYRCPILRVKAKSAVKNGSQRLIVEKGGDPNYPLGMEDLPSSQFYLCEFPIGYIQKGLHEKNKIIIKNQSVTENHSIYFDYLELDDQDQDGDGSLDCEEIGGDIDNDGVENFMDSDTATILVQSSCCEPKNNRTITLDIEEQENGTPYFTGLTLLDANSPDFPQEIPQGVFYPFGIFKAQIEWVGDIRQIMIGLYPPTETIYETARFYLYSDNGWQDLPVTIDPNYISVSLEAGNTWEYDPNRKFQDNDGMIIIGGLGYPEGLGIALDKSNCFISTLAISPQHIYDMDFFPRKRY